MGHRLSRIYTRTSDDGSTGLGDGTRVPKDLFDLGGELCMPGHRAIMAADVDRLEQVLDRFNAELPPLKRGSVAPHRAR
jgi:cob(I)alamin adenosyltransferase